MLWVTHAETEEASAPPSSLLLIFWTQLQIFFCGITNRLVMPVCFVFGVYRVKKWCKRIKNLSRVFVDEHTKKLLEDLERLSFKLNSRWVFTTVYRLQRSAWIKACMVDRRKAISLISSRDHCQRTSPSQFSDTPQVGL